MKIYVELIRISEMLDSAERDGSEKDDPEGARYITISDTLAKKISSDLRELANLSIGGDE